MLAQVMGTLKMRRNFDSCEKQVGAAFAANELAAIRKAFVVSAPNGFGKSSVVKLVIGMLHDRDPLSWRGSMSGKVYNPQRVVTTVSGDYSAVFDINGVIVAISSRGDAVKYVVQNFHFFGRVKAQVVVTAVRSANDDGSVSTMEHAYSRIQSQCGFESQTISLGKTSLVNDTSAEEELAKNIVGMIDDAVASILNQK